MIFPVPLAPLCSQDAATLKGGLILLDAALSCAFEAAEE